MNYYIKLHYLSDPDYEWRDDLSDSYNEALKVLWKEQEIFYDETRDEFTEKFYKDWIDYEENERYTEIFELEWYREMWGNYFRVVKINFSGTLEFEIDEFQERFLGLLKNKVQFIYKFEDNRFLEVRKAFFGDIYKVETSLREVISFIFFTTYYYDIENFLKDLKVNDVTGKLWLSQEDLRNSFENEFFYISFKDYRNLLKLSDLKELKETAISELIKDSHSFNDWKRRITERGIQDEPYADFIKSIKPDLEFLESFRNAVMHNHHYNQELKDGYEKAKESILRKTEEFKNTHINIFWNGLGLIPWNKYECDWDMMYFKKWKKYTLYKIDEVGNYIFIWEDWEEHYFRDKDLRESFKGCYFL